LRGRVGLFGGTFNPLHNAHLKVARTALEQLGLSEVVFIPNGIPPHKPIQPTVDKEDRLRMVSEAIADDPRLSVSRIEVDREGPSYTIDTIRALSHDYSQGICFIIGADRLLQIETWKEPEALLRSVPFVLAPRGGVNMRLFREPPFDGAELYVLEMEEVDLSSTHLRAKIRRGESIEGLVPASVARYVADHGLYEIGERTAFAPHETGG
jgi:nicotinate-nucleotide adenylyltransferase